MAKSMPPHHLRCTCTVLPVKLDLFDQLSKFPLKQHNTPTTPRPIINVRKQLYLRILYVLSLTTHTPQNSSAYFYVKLSHTQASPQPPSIPKKKKNCCTRPQGMNDSLVPICTVSKTHTHIQSKPPQSSNSSGGG